MSGSATEIMSGPELANILQLYRRLVNFGNDPGAAEMTDPLHSHLDNILDGLETKLRNPEVCFQY